MSLSTREIWGIPLGIGIVSAIGLVSALLGNGVWDVLSWIALGMPIAVIIWYVCVNSSSEWLKAGKWP